MAAISGMITFGLLVVLIDCLNGQNIPTHPDRMKIMAKGRAARIACNVDSSTLRSSAIHWYRVQPGGAFQRLMYFEAGKTNPKVDTGITYSGSVRNTQVSLTISKLQEDDAGSFFCALWTGDNRKVFGSGTRLYVTDSGKDKIVPPTLSAYLPTIKRSGKQTMLCQATGMFPDLVKFTWKKKSSTVDWTAVPEDKVVEQRNDDPKVIVTSMMIVDENTAGDDQYECTVTHEGSTEKPISKPLQKVSKDSNKPTDATLDSACPTASTEETEKKQISGTSEQMAGLYLFLYAYGVMLMKNGVYFCAVSIFLLKRKFGKKEESA